MSYDTKLSMYSAFYHANHRFKRNVSARLLVDWHFTNTRVCLIRDWFGGIRAYLAGEDFPIWGGYWNMLGVSQVYHREPANSGEQHTIMA